MDSIPQQSINCTTILRNIDYFLHKTLGLYYRFYLYFVVLILIILVSNYLLYIFLKINHKKIIFQRIKYFIETTPYNDCV